VERLRVIDLGADARGLQVRAQGVAARGADAELVIGVRRVVGGRPQLGRQLRLREERAIRRRVRAARGGPRRHVRQLGAQHGRL